jgi:NAD(P)-dependent dehydrogenase (short-subunit alcohol dehydrogenase family)
MKLSKGAWVSILLGAVAAGGAIALRNARRMSFRGRTVLITGGSRGLGLELARFWGAEGARVIICARTLDDVDRAVYGLRARGCDAHGEQCDITSPQQVRELVARVLERWGAIDVVVNNAGIIQVGPQSCMTIDDYEDAMSTHFWGPLYVIETVLPHMRRRRQGRIVNIASIGGEISVPHLLPYCASKFALVGYSEGLAAELASEGIRVTTVCPGIMRTGSPRNANFKGQHRNEYAWFSIGASIPGITAGSRRAARAIVGACRAGRPYLRITLPSVVGARLHALLPNLSVAAMRVVNSLLPAPVEGGQIKRKGWQSFSEWSPSSITWLNEQAAAANNEVRPGSSC